MCVVESAVSSCSCTLDAYPWILEVTDDDATFDALSICELRFESLDSKLRTALTRFTVGDQANKHRELSNVIVKATEDCKRRRVLIRRRQLLHLVFTFYQVDTDKRIKFDLMNITSIEYPGDAHMAKFLFEWDDMLNNMKDGVTLDQKFLEEVMIGVIRKSEDLKIYVDYYDRQFKDSPDRNYAYLHKTIAKVVLEKRQRLNKEALLVDHSAQRRGRPQVAAVLTPDPNTSTQKGENQRKREGSRRRRQRQRQQRIRYAEGTLVRHQVRGPLLHTQPLAQVHGGRGKWRLQVRPARPGGARVHQEAPALRQHGSGERYACAAEAAQGQRQEAKARPKAKARARMSLPPFLATRRPSRSSSHRGVAAQVGAALARPARRHP